MKKGIIYTTNNQNGLFPLHPEMSVQLLLVYNKPMIYYPLSTLMSAGVQEILIISPPKAVPQFQNILSNGAKWGLNISYIAQTAPLSLVDAFNLSADFIGSDPVCLILGDNIFYGGGLSILLREMLPLPHGAVIFAYPEKEPPYNGFVEFSEGGSPIKIIDKPRSPKAKFAIPDLYIYDNQVIEIAANLTPPTHGEIGINDINRIYMDHNQLYVHELDSTNTWLNANSPKSLLCAANFIYSVEEQQDKLIACPEEIAYQMGFIDLSQFKSLAEELKHTQYGRSLLRLLHDELAIDGL